MQDLINIIENEAISARDLYVFLEVKITFEDWISNILKYGFRAGEDYIMQLKNKRLNQQSNDYVLTIDMAKHILIFDNGIKSRQVRKYFIKCEEIAKNILANNQSKKEPKTYSETLRELADKNN